MQQSDEDLRVVRLVFEGGHALREIPQIASKIVRIFTSSTFTDTALERNSLMENVYPKLKDYCREKYGLEFQVVDMRWGVRDEATDDHKTTELCMQEIDNCQRLSLGPNFVVFLGQKYGYRPLPTRILEHEFKAILDALKTQAEDIELLKTWYKLDSNSIPTFYILQQVSSIYKNFTNKSAKSLMEEDQNKWWKTLGSLCGVLRKGTKILFDSKKISHMDNHRFNWSVTEQEVCRGVLEAIDNVEHTLCFIREIKGINTHAIQHASKFIDFNFSAKKVDEEAQSMLRELRDSKVPNKLAESNIIKYQIDWIDDEGISLKDHRKYIDEFSDTFYTRIVQLIDKAILKQKIYPHYKLFSEALQHLHFCRNFTKMFQGRDEVLEGIKKYICDETRSQPFVIYGLPGSGKTSILAKTHFAIKDWQTIKCNPILIIRFLGTTPDSSSINPLYKSVCSQLSFVFNQPLEAIPEDLSQLTNYFKKLLGLATSDRPLFIIFDSLDQLSASNSAYSLSWLPASLPKHVKFILSTLNESNNILSNLKIMIENHENFIEINPLGQHLGLSVLNFHLKHINRTISQEQWPVVKEALERCNTPLYVKLVFDRISLWKSYTTDVSIPPSIAECISILFDRIENQHGKTLVEHSLAYITASKNGLSEAELEDLISLDEIVLNDIYQYHLPPIRRIPPLLWTRIRNDLHSYLSEREADGISVVYWYHKQFIEVSTHRFFASQEFKSYIHSQISDYFMGIWSSKPKPFTYTQEQKRMFMLKSLDGAADRKVPAQPDVFISKNDGTKRFNCRKLSELPYHLLRSNRTQELFDRILFNYEFLHAKLSCMPLNSLIADYEDYLAVNGYHEQVALVSDALRLSSSMLIQNASNLAPQLIGRLLHYRSDKYINVKSLIEQCESNGLSDCALVPVFNCYHMPGGPLVFSLEGHPFAVYGLCLLNDAIQLISISNRFIVFDLTSGEIVRQVMPQIDGIMQMLSVSPNKKFCVSFNTNDQIVFWRMTNNDCKVLTRPLLSSEAIKKLPKRHRIDPLIGCYSNEDFFVVWSKYCYYVYSTNFKLIKQEHVEYPLVQIELVSRVFGCELEIIARTEDCYDDEEKERDNLMIDYSLLVNNHTFEYKPHALRFDFHSAIVLTKDKSRLYTCIEIADHCIECFRNKFENQFKPNESPKVWKYHKSLEDNYDRVLALILSDDERYLLAILPSCLKVYFILTSQSMPLKLPKNVKNFQIGHKKLTFPALFTKDNQYVIAGIRNSIFIWDCSYGNLLKTLDAHYGRITCLLGSSSDIKDIVISSSMDKTIKIWNMKNILERDLQIDHLDKPIECIHISTEAYVALAQSRNQLALVSLKDGKIKRFLHNEKYGSLFSCSALTINGDYAASGESNKLVMWDLDEMSVTFASELFSSNFTIKQLQFFNSEINIICSKIDNNTKQISIMNYTIPDGDLVYKIDYSIKNFADYKNFVVTCDESYLAFYRNDKKFDVIAVYNAEDGTHIHNFKLQFAGYTSLFTLIALPSNSKHIALIDADKGNIVNVCDKKFIRSVAKWNGICTNDGKFGLYSPQRGGLEIIDLKTSTKIRTLIPKIAEGVFDIDSHLTQDNKFIVYYHSGRRSMRIFRFDDGHEMANLKCHAKVKCIRTSQDGRHVVIGCEDGTICLYLIVDPQDNACREYLTNWRQIQVTHLNESELSITEEHQEEILF